ncbi:N-acetyltransferase [Flagellimonas aquimarina]|uniref:N-acetyltransferase n=1 Tax=Flagellimonas aquimarina TaxID=2201895 RepID=A0A316L2S2_9FLAO|nr:GNAT family N-acetyltransferase [Allomuricauda koreensis]PWL40136.1 N-acetyltransferase [Allomuricauda koreensis]
MIVYEQTSTLAQLEEILSLQQLNLPNKLSMEEKEQEGFLTVEHSLDVLKEMHAKCPHIIAVDEGNVVGYALCMHPQFAHSIEVLKPMFHEIDKMVQNNQNHMVMGQICVAKEYRGQGIFRGLYKTMKENLPEGFDGIITEVDAKNQRSLNAHKAVGFTELKKYSSEGKDWHLILLT